MPTLKQITCTVEWSKSNTPLKEHQTMYGDGYVQTFVAVPSFSTPFSVHLQSKGYIAPGLAMFVYMDGEYQCNRNRQNLKIPNETTTPRQTEIDFRVRQKEEVQPDGTFAGSQWKFRELNVVPNPNMSAAPSNVEHIGTVEVVVLRCYPMDRPTKSGLSQPVPILKSGQHNKAQQGVSTPIPSPVDSSQDNSSSDGNDPQSGFGSLFDGTGGCVPLHTSSFNFGGDASWDNTRQEWDNDGRDSWQQQADPQQWNNVSAMNSTSTVRQGQATDGQWDNRSSHAPSVRQSRSRSHNGSKPSRRSSVTEDIPHVPSPHMTWESQQGAQPSAPNPAVVVNVIQPGATFVPPPNPGWKPQGAAGSVQSADTKALPPPVENQSPDKSSSSESKKSGSGSSGWNDNNVANNKNATDEWHDASIGTQDWTTNPPKTPNVPGAWADNESHPQAATQWESNGNRGDFWAVPNQPTQGSQPANSQNGWNNGRNDGNGNPINSRTNGPTQQNYWDSGTTYGNGNGNENWDNNSSPQQIAGATSPEQNTGGYGNANSNANGNGTAQCNQTQPNQGQNWGASNNGDNNAGGQAWNSFENPQRGSQASKKALSMNSKHSNRAPSIAHGVLQSTPAGFPSSNLIHAGSMPLQPKPYWSIWKAGPDTDTGGRLPLPESESEVAEGPVHSVPRDVAQRQMMSHQVLLGKPAIYMHKVSKPKYMDTHESPYAAFTFHYRSKEILQQMLGVKLVEREEDEKERLSVLSKEELIEHLLKAKSIAGSHKPSSSSTDSSSFKASNNTVIHKANSPTELGLGFGGLLANKLSRLATNDLASSGKPTTNPELLWGRPANQGLGLRGGPNASTNDNVTGWLNNSGGGHLGSPVVGPSQPTLDPMMSGGGQMTSLAAGPPQHNWNGNGGGSGNIMSGGNSAGPWVIRTAGQVPPGTSPCIRSNNGNGDQNNDFWKGDGHRGSGQNPSLNGFQEGVRTNNNGVWYNGSGNGAGGLQGGGWNNSNGSQSGPNNNRKGGTAAPISGW